MRRFRSIVQSVDAPDIDSIWITNDNKIKYFNGNGCVRKGTGVQNLSNDAGISDIISTINNLLSSLRTAGILNSIIWEK